MTLFFSYFPQKRCVQKNKQNAWEFKKEPTKIISRNFDTTYYQRLLPIVVLINTSLNRLRSHEQIHFDKMTNAL